LLVPDSLLARRAEELVREVSPPFLANHCRRCFEWSTALAQRDGVRFDAELLYVGAALQTSDLFLASIRIGASRMTAPRQRR
jgi:hypothetical protein